LKKLKQQSPQKVEIIAEEEEEKGPTNVFRTMDN
jgi:hypothetical protein